MPNTTTQVAMASCHVAYNMIKSLPLSPDVLLCHDDELEGRHIAYIYYLVDTAWEEKDGG